MHFLDALILGIVEGLTEFLPVSSTGHLILAARLLHLPATEFLSTFEVVIQLGAILAVVALYFKRFLTDWQTNKKLLVALLPSLVVGGLFYPFIKTLFDSPETVVVALAVGGFLILLIEWFEKDRPKRITDVREVSYTTALAIGICQAFAVIPGVSRAAATIMGGLLLGLERRAIVEFSFLLAVPTMLAASSIDLYKSTFAWTGQELALLLVGFVSAFVVALLAVRLLLRFVATHTFAPFGIYRIILALLFFFLILR
jgi:undecaprenyl-diphosphatase